MMSHASCIFPSDKKSLNHRRLSREEPSEMLVTYFGVDPTKVANEVADTKVIMLDLNSWKSFIKTTYSGLRMLMVIICRLSITRLVN